MLGLASAQAVACIVRQRADLIVAHATNGSKLKTQGSMQLMGESGTIGSSEEESG